MVGKKVFLRCLEETDIPRTQQWINDPEISSIMGYLPVKSLKQQINWYNSIINDNTRFIFAICLKDTNEHIGNVALGRVDYLNRNGMFSIFIYERKYRGSGFGSEATQLVLDFAFNRLNLHRVYLQTSPNFEAAISLYEHLGFVKEGVLREHYYINGEYTDKVIYSLLRKEYIATLR
jgi:RimJ/RimL family protein N-acetyltransferase